MTTRPTDLDTQQHTVEVLHSAAEELDEKLLALGMMGTPELKLEGLRIAIRYLLLEAQDIKEGATDDKSN